MTCRKRPKLKRNPSRPVGMSNRFIKPQEPKYIQGKVKVNKRVTKSEIRLTKRSQLVEERVRHRQAIAKINSQKKQEIANENRKHNRMRKIIDERNKKAMKNFGYC